MNEHGHRAYGLAPLQGGAQAMRPVRCPMCAQPAGGATSCGACGAPLTPPPKLEEPSEAFVGRRGSPRVERVESALWEPAGDGERMTVRLHDLSFTGLSLEAFLPVPEGQIARVKAPNIDCVVQVVQCRREAGDWRVHARLLTMRLLTRAGAFVSTVV
jgi:hypothetical protein